MAYVIIAAEKEYKDSMILDKTVIAIVKKYVHLVSSTSHDTG